MAKVFLDAGHGGKDAGAVGNGLKEKDINLSVTLKIGEILKSHGIEVVYSRVNDVFIELSDIAKKANNSKADIFVSIHCNSFRYSSAKGMETYSYPNSLQGAKLSKNIYDSIIKDKVYTANRGTKTENFAVLRLTNMPATLVELAFVSNSQDAYILKNRQQELALAVAKGILNNLGIKYRAELVKLDKPEENLDGKVYKVQVGVFSDIKNAEKLISELKSKGYEAIIVN